MGTLPSKKNYFRGMMSSLSNKLYPLDPSSIVKKVERDFEDINNSNNTGSILQSIDTTIARDRNMESLRDYRPQNYDYVPYDENPSTSSTSSNYRTSQNDTPSLGKEDPTAPFPKINPFSHNLFNDPNSTFSGSDCLVIAQINHKQILLGNVQTFTYSTFIEKGPVRVLGRKHPKMYVAGGRTISGSIVFAVFDQNPVYNIIKELYHNVRSPDTRHSLPLPDMIPPIDFILLFENEYGHKSIIRLYAVEFFQEGQTHSVNDIYTENVMQYVCRDMDVMIDYKELGKYKNMLFEKQVHGLFVDHHLHSMLKIREQILFKMGEIDSEVSSIARNSSDTIDSSAEKRYSQLLILKENLYKELSLIDSKIESHEKKLSGWNAQNTEFGSSTRYKLESAPIGGNR